MVEFVFQRGTDKTFEQQYYEYLQNIKYLKSIKTQSDFDRFKKQEKQKIIKNKTVINKVNQTFSTKTLEKLLESGFESINDVLVSSFATLEQEQKELKSVISDIHSYMVEMDQSTKRYINQIISYLKLPDSEKKIKADLERAIEFFNVSELNPKYLEQAIELFNNVLEHDNGNIIANYYMGIIKMSVPEYLNLEMAKVHLELAHFFGVPLLKGKSSFDAKKLYENILLQIIKIHLLSETPDLVKIKDRLNELYSITTTSNIKIDYYNLIYHIKNNSDYDLIYEAFIEFIKHNKEFAKIKCLTTKDIYEYSKFDELLKEFNSETITLLKTFKNNALQRVWKEIPKDLHSAIDKFFEIKGPEMTQEEIEYFHEYNPKNFIAKVKPFIEWQLDESELNFNIEDSIKTYKNIIKNLWFSNLLFFGIYTTINISLFFILKTISIFLATPVAILLFIFFSWHICEIDLNLSEKSQEINLNLEGKYSDWLLTAYIHQPYIDALFKVNRLKYDLYYKLTKIQNTLITITGIITLLIFLI